MALFTNKKKTVQGGGEKKTPSSRIANVLLRPWISEKALMGSERGVYAFEILRSATKTEVREAIVAAYKVTPRMVRIVNTPGGHLRLQSRRSAKRAHKRSEGKKAYVYLKKGDSIALF